VILVHVQQYIYFCQYIIVAVMKNALVSLPAPVQTVLFLIREELKSRKLFHTLNKAGITNCYFQPHLDELILDSLGIDATSDEAFATYNTIVDRRSRKIEADNDSVMKQALKVYHELLIEKKKRCTEKVI
jgi:hypothetical protein